MKGIILMIMLFVVGLGLSLVSGAYADSVQVLTPFEVKAMSCQFQQELFIICYFLGEGLGISHIPNIGLEILENVTITTSILPVIETPETPDEESPIEEPKELTQLEKQKIAVDERRTEIEAEKEKLIGELSECRTGLGAFAAYQEQAPIEDYTNQTRWQFATRDNLSNSPVLTILKAIEECDIMKDYIRLNLISEYELNKYLADLAGTDYLGRTAEHPLNPSITDQSDSMVETDEVTPKDIAQEVDEMEKIKQRLIDERKFEDPDADLTGINRGFQPTGLNCSVFGQPAPVGSYPAEVCPLSMYDAHILKNWDSITYGDIKELQCDNFLYIYQHKIGTDDFPTWLNHCVPKVVLK